MRINWKLLSFVLIATTIVASTMLVANQLTVWPMGSPQVAEAHLTVPHNTVHSATIIDESIFAADIVTAGVGAAEIQADAVGDEELAGSILYNGRLAFNPGTIITVAANELATPAPFGLGIVATHNFVQINCNDPDGCVIPSTGALNDINPGIPGQILIISTTDFNDVTVNEEITPAAGVTQVNLAAASRTLAERGDTLVLLFHDGEWNELNFQSVGPP